MCSFASSGRVFVLGAGASAFAGYPLAPGLLGFIRDFDSVEVRTKEIASRILDKLNTAEFLFYRNVIRNPDRVHNLEELLTYLELYHSFPGTLFQPWDSSDTGTSTRTFISKLPSYSSPSEPTNVNLRQIGPPLLSALLELAELIPSELLTMDNEAYASLISAQSEIRDTPKLWNSDRDKGYALSNRFYHSSNDPVSLIHKALSQCPDESPAPATSELKFVADPDLRTNLRNDIGAINRALSNGEWKAATVLTGSAIEALLLWDLQNRRAANVPPAIASLVANNTFSRQPPTNLEEWTLHHYIEVAANLGIIKPETATQARLAKDFRNLIHPGRAQRLAQNCDRGTALSCVAALEHVVRDLT